LLLAVTKEDGRRRPLRPSAGQIDRDVAAYIAEVSAD
jgi:hypothetical protein